MGIWCVRRAISMLPLGGQESKLCHVRFSEVGPLLLFQAHRKCKHLKSSACTWGKVRRGSHLVQVTQAPFTRAMRAGLKFATHCRIAKRPLGFGIGAIICHALAYHTTR
eukprot:scaffold34929_cov17-Tisochrysis_lutea.AAC.1